MSYVEEIETLRKVIDRIDMEVVEKLAEWVQVSKEIGHTNGESSMAQIKGFAREHGLDIEGMERIFQAMAALVEKRGAG